MPKHQKPFSVLEAGIVEAVREGDGCAQTILDGVEAVMFVALKDAGSMGHALRDAAPLIAGAAVRGGVKARGDLGYVARGFMAGLLRASKFKGTRAQDLIGVGVSSFFLNAAEAGADPADISRSLVEGVIEWAAELGEDTSAAASAAARAALSAARVIDPKTARGVHDVLKDGVATVDIVFGEGYHTPA
jgi:hypothetical protein